MKVIELKVKVAEQSDDLVLCAEEPTGIHPDFGNPIRRTYYVITREDASKIADFVKGAALK